MVWGLLVQRLGVAELVDERVTLDGPGRANAGVKALTVIGSALAGGDCVADVDVLRAGATARAFDEVRAPRRSATGAARLPVSERPPARRGHLRAARPGVDGAAGPDLEADLTIDIDSTVCVAYGPAKQAGQGSPTPGCVGTTH